MKEHILITGGAGFLGSHLVDYYIQCGANVTVVDNFRTGYRDNLAGVASKIKLFNIDIRKPYWLRSVELSKFDIIFHLAAHVSVPDSVKKPGLDFRLNLLPTYRLLDRLRRINWRGRLIYPSSSTVYGNPVRTPISEDDPVIPISPYSVSKLAAEQYIAVYTKLYQLRAVSVRLFSLYGPRQRRLLVIDLFKKLLVNNKELNLYGDGTQVRDLIHVKDVVMILARIVEVAPLRGEVFNIGSGNGCSIRELVNLMCTIMSISPNIKYSGNSNVAESQSLIANIDRLRQLGISPSIDLTTGLNETLLWLLSQTNA